MIVARYANFVAHERLQDINNELQSVPRWIYRNRSPNNFWRYYLSDGLPRYNERDRSTWHGNHMAGLIDNLKAIWKDLFHEVHALAGSNFCLMRYTINGQTHGQEGEFHYDVSPDLPGQYLSYLLYLNTEWHDEWAGATELQQSSGQVIHEMPCPGTMIVFDSKTLHRGRAPLPNDVLRLTMLWHGQHS